MKKYVVYWPWFDDKWEGYEHFYSSFERLKNDNDWWTREQLRNLAVPDGWVEGINYAILTEKEAESLDIMEEL